MDILAIAITSGLAIFFFLYKEWDKKKCKLSIMIDYNKTIKTTHNNINYLIINIIIRNRNNYKISGIALDVYPKKPIIDNLYSVRKVVNSSNSLFISDPTELIADSYKNIPLSLDQKESKRVNLILESKENPIKIIANFSENRLEIKVKKITNFEILKQTYTSTTVIPTPIGRL